MKNKEKFAKEIIDIACKGDIIAVTKDNKVVGCDDIYCDQCLFDIDNLCHRGDNILYRWAESEYVEKPTITSREKKFLDVLLPSCKYITRDNSNELYIYNKKPTRTDCNWYSNDGTLDCISTNLFGNMFDFIRWEDEEPWSIEDLKKLEVKDE